MPKEGFVFTKLAAQVESKCGGKLTQPKVFKDPTGNFFIAIASVDSPLRQELVAKTFRYFDYDNKPCRALAHSDEIKSGINSSVGD